MLFDCEEVFEDLKPFANSYCSRDYEKFIDEIIKYYNDNIKETEYDMVMIIAGVDKLKEEISFVKINELFKIIKQNDNIVSILVDDAFKMKKLNFESWYTDNVISSNGIWLGSGVTEQSVIKYNDFSKKYNIKITDEFAWVFKNGIGQVVKIINYKENEGKNDELNWQDNIIVIFL